MNLTASPARFSVERLRSLLPTPEEILTREALGRGARRVERPFDHPWAAWGPAALYLRSAACHARGDTKEEQYEARKACLRELLAVLARQPHKYGLHVSLGDATVPFYSLNLECNFRCSSILM